MRSFGYDTKDDTVWTPKVGDVSIVHGSYSSHRLGVLWKNTGRTVQYYRQNRWNALHRYLQGGGDKPYVSITMAERDRWKKEPLKVWQRKIAPFPFDLLSDRNKKKVRDIQDELGSPREPLFQKIDTDGQQN